MHAVTTFMVMLTAVAWFRKPRMLKKVQSFTQLCCMSPENNPSEGQRSRCLSVLVTVHVCDLPIAEMNRHHYSLYVHNCRLVFLLRRDFTQVDTFRPAEFHWKLEQVRSVFVWARLCPVWAGALFQVDFFLQRVKGYHHLFRGRGASPF